MMGVVGNWYYWVWKYSRAFALSPPSQLHHCWSVSSIWVPSSFNFFSYILSGIVAKAFKFQFFFYFCFLGLLSLHSLYTVLDLDPLILPTIHTYPFQEMVIWVFIPLLNTVSLFGFMATSLVLLFHFSISAWKGELFPIRVSIRVCKNCHFFLRVHLSVTVW